MAKQERRYAGYDGRAPDVNSDVPAGLMPWVSDNWTKLFKWRGDGPMPAAERAKLQEFVTAAHKHGRLGAVLGDAGKAGVLGRTAGCRCGSDQHRSTCRFAKVLHAIVVTTNPPEDRIRVRHSARSARRLGRFRSGAVRHAAVSRRRNSATIGPKPGRVSRSSIGSITDYQTYDFVRAKEAEYLPLTKKRMGVWEAMEFLNTLVDDSDPDTDLSQIEHLLQTAEAIRRDGHPPGSSSPG